VSISRLTIRGSDDNVRSPPRTGVHFVDGPATSATLAPGTSRDIAVTWLPAEATHPRQAFGHVLITSNDDARSEVAMGFHANLPTPLGSLGARSLSLLVALPLLVPLWIAARRLGMPSVERSMRAPFLAMAAAELATALYVFQRFLPGIGRADGNDGYQAIERCAWVRAIGAEYHVGVDGLSVGLVLLVAILALVAGALTPPQRMTGAYWAALALLVSGAMLVLVALDVVLLFAAWVIVVLSVVLVVSSSETARSRRSAAKALLVGALGSAALLVVLVALSLASGRTFLVDGSPADHTLMLPELARTNLLAVGPIFGIPFIDFVWTLLLVAVAAATPIIPLHGWLPDAIEDAPTGAGILVAGAATTLGPYVLVRVGLQAMPEGARWASDTMCAMGAIQVAYAGCCALEQRSLRRFAAYATLAQAGVWLFALGSLSSRGLAGGISGQFAHGLAAAALLGTIGAIELRRGTGDLAGLRGMTQDSPELTELMGALLAASLGVPGFAVFWALLLSVLGGFAGHPSLAIVVVGGWVASVAAHGRIAQESWSGASTSIHDGGPQHEPSKSGPSASIPSTTLATTVIPLLLVSLLLGLWPTPLLATMAATTADIIREVEPAAASATTPAR
jgi:NADH-quinone oxidoreductase subunit M